MKLAARFLLTTVLFLFASSGMTQDEFEDAFQINPSLEKKFDSAEDFDSGRISIMGSEDSESNDPDNSDKNTSVSSEDADRPVNENETSDFDLFDSQVRPMIRESQRELESRSKARPSEQQEPMIEKQISTQVNTERSGQELVEVRTNESIYYPYKQRQSQWGFSFSLGAENVNYPGLISQFDEESFETLYGSSGSPMLSLELGPRYNMSWGSLALLAGYGLLDISDDRSGANDELTIQKYSATAVFYLDSLWAEPYLVPYVGAGVWSADYSEIRGAFPDEVSNTATDIGYQYRVGALLGLDWIEPSTTLRARRETGMKAIFVNVYASSTFMSESDPDPDLENDMDFGASLMFEF